MAVNPLADLLASWRQAERAKAEHPFGSAEYDAASEAADHLRALYQAAVAGPWREASRSSAFDDQEADRRLPERLSLS